MNGINKIFLAGNIVKKPALHKNKNGKSFSFLKIATNRFSYNQGAWDKKTDWHSVLVWGRKAELCERFLEKGTPLAVEGFLENTQSDKTLLIAEDVHFLGLRTRSVEETSDMPGSEPSEAEAEDNEWTEADGQEADGAAKEAVYF